MLWLAAEIAVLAQLLAEDRLLFLYFESSPGLENSSMVVVLVLALRIYPNSVECEESILIALFSLLYMRYSPLHSDTSQVLGCQSPGSQGP